MEEVEEVKVVEVVEVEVEEVEVGGGGEGGGAVERLQALHPDEGRLASLAREATHLLEPVVHGQVDLVHALE